VLRDRRDGLYALYSPDGHGDWTDCLGCMHCTAGYGLTSPMYYSSGGISNTGIFETYSRREYDRTVGNVAYSAAIGGLNRPIGNCL
jgi:hypothetical protein